MSFTMSLLGVCLCVYFGLIFGSKIYARVSPKDYFSHSEKIDSGAFYIALILDSALLSGLTISFPQFGMFLIWAIAGLTFLWMEQKKLSSRMRVFIQLLLCFMGVLGLSYEYLNLTLTSLLLLSFLTFGWWVLWRVFVWFDRFPLTSSLVSFSWFMALFLVGVLMKGFPIGILTPLSLLGVALLAFNRLRFPKNDPCLGNRVANLSGFIWAGIWTYFLLQGAFFQVLNVYGYYLFEGIVLGIAFIKRQPLKTFLTSCLEHPQYAKKTVWIIFSHLLVLSFLGVMTMHMPVTVWPVLVFVLVVVLLDLYMRLNAFEHPIPTLREIFSDMKQSIASLSQQVKDKKSVAQKTASVKTAKKSSKKKVTVQKKSAKKRKSKK